MAPRSKNTLAKAAGAEPWPDERLKIARRCGTKHISKSKGAKHTRFGPLLEVDMSKKCTPLWLEAHVQVKCTKHTMLGPLLEVDMSKKCSQCGAKHIFKSKCKKHHMLGPLLKVQMWFCVAGAREFAPCQKCAKREGFVVFPKTMAGVGHLKRICIFRGRRSTRDMFIRAVRRSGR